MLRPSLDAHFNSGRVWEDREHVNGQDEGKREETFWYGISSKGRLGMQLNKCLISLRNHSKERQLNGPILSFTWEYASRRVKTPWGQTDYIYTILDIIDH